MKPIQSRTTGSNVRQNDWETGIQAQPSVAQQSVPVRLRERIKSAKKLGFDVRIERLHDQTPSWCVVGNSKWIFLDSAASTREQLSQLEEILAEHGRRSAA